MRDTVPALNFILKVLVGSRAHGLHHENSDYDYRGVFVQPTSAILGLSATVQQTSWVEGDDRRVEEAAEHCTHRPDLDRVNEFLLDVRRRCW